MGTACICARIGRRKAPRKDMILKKYYYTEDWYEKCCGLVIIGDKTGERLTGEQAYRHIQESARIFKEKETGSAQGEAFF